ncbi:PREDICTED: uncharacterized protein LOC100636561 [Amphimedon queenslandica]|uniref:Kazal-like domain-containing protein n=1 Tax=Amphimedon queenslandica TaxID=400682 RepID=A0A1X7VWI2_AMPQE|nr:PREDICTED: uncharacterized protein LOC100636561 [Amphimedon queenslandica]|eukprot:XP_003382539.1 PREDICTED: uncharacterized protein LOC100636561 [Amphimedon queenslandica]
MNHHLYLVAFTVILLYLTSCSTGVVMMTNYPVSTAVMGSGISDTTAGMVASISNEVYATKSNSINIEATTASSTIRSAKNVIASSTMMNPLPSISPTSNSRPPSTCFEQVDHILIELGGLTNKTDEEILDDFCDITITTANSYCRRNWTANCQLPSGFTGEYNLNNCHACYKKLRAKAAVSSSLRYFLTQPNNANSVLNFNAMLTIARQALPAFEASTGLTTLYVSSFNANPPTRQTPSEQVRNSLKLFIELWGILGGLILACAIVLIIFSIIIAVACCIKMKMKKKENRVEPNKNKKAKKGSN